jgi:SAM-dependent methyltransferase
VSASDRELTEQRFWEDWHALGHGLSVDLAQPMERGLARALAEHAPVRPGDRVLELGCAPGRWLVHYARTYGAAVEGLEYTEEGIRRTEENFRRTEIDGELHRGDFWDWTPTASYDLVLSLGFVEHFADVDRAFERHVQLVRPGGVVAVSVPNFQGVNRVLQRWFKAEWLELHNRDAMGAAGWARRAAAHGLETRFLGYVGGFDSDVIALSRRPGRRLLGPLWRLRRAGVGDRLNAWWLSACLLGVFERPR